MAPPRNDPSSVSSFVLGSLKLGCETGFNISCNVRGGALAPRWPDRSAWEAGLGGARLDLVFRGRASAAADRWRVCGVILDNHRLRGTK